MGDSIGDYWNMGMEYYKKAVNVIMQYGEYEIKVRDATGNEPWGASSKLMLEIAEATHHYQGFNETMETILKRFQEPCEKWRCVYKSLTLLEYLVKNGSERVIDFARDHVYEIKALKNFHYVSEAGKDEGLNVRNRAKELSDLLADTDRIKAERKKARQNRSKYTGVSADEMRMGVSGFGSSSSSRYQGFGSDSYSGSGGGSSSGGGAGSFSSSGGYPGSRGSGSRRHNSEMNNGRYDSDDNRGSGRDGDRSPSPPLPAEPRGGASSNSPSRSANKPTPPTPSAASNLVDLLDDLPTSFGNMSTGGSATNFGGADDDDEFGGFQTAEPVTSKAPASSSSGAGILDLDFGGARPTTAAPKTSAPSKPFTDSWADFGSAPTPSLAGPPKPTSTTSSLPPPLAVSTPPPVGGKSQDPFASLFDLSASALAPNSKAEPKAGPSLNSLPITAKPPSFAASFNGAPSGASGADDSLI